MEEHLKYVEAKGIRIAMSMYELRKTGNAKLLLNMFKILVTPSYKLLLGGTITRSKNDEEEVAKSMRKSLKMWMNLPRGTPNYIV